MRTIDPLEPGRRQRRRVAVESFCSLLTRKSERHALVTDVSATGLRILRPIGGPRARELQLEFEIPEIDEIVWARGEICFDQVWGIPRLGGGISHMMRTSGIRLTRTAGRHSRLLQDYVHEQRRRWIQDVRALPGVAPFVGPCAAV